MSFCSWAKTAMQGHLQKPSWSMSKLFRNEIWRESKRLRHQTAYSFYRHNCPALDLETETCTSSAHHHRMCQLPAVKKSPTLPSVRSSVATATEKLCCCPDWQPDRILQFCILLSGDRWRLSTMGAQQVFSRYEVMFNTVQRWIGTSWVPCLTANAYCRR